LLRKENSSGKLELAEIEIKMQRKRESVKK
jgi:hypothetical protein